MADIKKDNVQTYVWELISKEFGSEKKTGKIFSDNQRLNAGDHQNETNQPVRNSLTNE